MVVPLEAAVLSNGTERLCLVPTPRVGVGVGVGARGPSDTTTAHGDSDSHIVWCLPPVGPVVTPTIFK